VHHDPHSKRRLRGACSSPRAGTEALIRSRAEVDLGCLLGLRRAWLAVAWRWRAVLPGLRSSTAQPGSADAGGAAGSDGYDSIWRGRSEAGQSSSRAPTTAMCSAKRWAGSAGSVPVKVFTLASR
jgi:hypothetical protein